jgi:hypothetical protein
MTDASSPRRSADVLAEFWELVEADMLPRYGEETGYGIDGWTGHKEVDAGDAEWFMAAIRSGLVEQLPKGDLWLPASRYKTTVFWEDLTTVVPRPIYFYIEGFLSVATAARLHMIYGWSKHALGFESKDYAFDLIGRMPASRREYLAGEAKSTSDNVATLIEGVRSCGKEGSHTEAVHGSKAAKNAHKKWAGLAVSKAPVFFVFGPAREWYVFAVEHGPGKRVALTPASEALLHCPSYGEGR